VAAVSGSIYTDYYNLSVYNKLSGVGVSGWQSNTTVYNVTTSGFYSLYLSGSLGNEVLYFSPTP
jgi:hypothetical protein